MTPADHDQPLHHRRRLSRLLGASVLVVLLAWGAKTFAAPNDSATDLMASWVLGDDTEYAHDYSESGWSQVRQGMPEHIVRMMLGTPLDDEKVEVGAYGKRVARLARYTRERSTDKDAGGHWTRVIAYDSDDLVIFKKGHYLVD